MEKKVNLKKLEKSTAAVVFQAGITDIGIGMIFLISTLASLFDDIRYYIYLLFIVPPVFISLAMRNIVNPRMGVVKLNKKRRTKSMTMIIIITVFLNIMVVLTFFGLGNSSLEELINPRWIITGIIFAICVSVAYILEYHRMYLYAFIIAGAFNLSEYLRDHPEIVSNNGMAYLIAAIIILAIGGYHLSVFLKKYPMEKELY